MNTWIAGIDLMRSYNKKDFYSNLNIEHITDVDYRHAVYLKILIVKI